MAELKLNNLKKLVFLKEKRVREISRPRFSYLMIAFFAGFVLMVIGGLASPKFRDAFFKTADFFSGSETAQHSAAPPRPFSEAGGETLFWASSPRALPWCS